MIGRKVYYLHIRVPRKEELKVYVILERKLPVGDCWQGKLSFGFLEMGTLILEQSALFSSKSPG
jgi:hypothetical protein